MHHVPCELESLIPNQIIPKEYAPLIHLSRSDWFLESCLVYQSYTTKLKKNILPKLKINFKGELKVALGSKFYFFCGKTLLT